MEKQTKKKGIIRRFGVYYRPHRTLFILDMLASFLISAIGILYPIVTRSMLNDFIPNRNYTMILYAGLGVLGLYVIRMLLNYFVQYYGHVMGVRMQAQMRTDLFNHLEKLPYSFFDNNETGKIMSRLTSDLFEISELAHHGPENLLISSISVIAAFTFLCTINVYLTLIVFAVVPFLFVITLTLRRRMKRAFKKRREYNAEINASLESSISGVRVTKAFTNADVELEKFERGNDRFQQASIEGYKAMGQFHSANSFVTDVFNVVVLICGGLFLYAGKISFADYSAFIVSVGMFITPITTIINFSEQYENGVSGFERFLEIMDEPPERERQDALELKNVQGEIRFDHVTFAYDGAHDVLKDVSFTIEKGKRFALVGPSGGGKTTICHLIPRFYQTTEGGVYIDGKEISTVTAESLRKNVGIVQQDIYLFNASIKDNILYGKPDATDEEVIAAAKRANIHDYVMSLEDGYDTVIGERGVKLSGGQKQRISIARVFLKNPPILLLDEATSALDNATEVLIQEALDELCKGRTTVIVAHRLSTIKHAEEIAVVEEGVITERGTHAELMEKNGTYANLYSKQFRTDD